MGLSIPMLGGYGYYYFPQGSAENGLGSIPFETPTWCPIWLAGGLTLDRLGCEVTVPNVGAVMRMGIYADNGYLRPSALLLDGGTAPATSVGNTEATISYVVPADDLYWLCGCNQIGSGIRVRLIEIGFDETDSPLLGFSYNGSAVPGGFIWKTAASVSGALPATAPGLDASQRVPRIYVRVQ